MQNVVFSGRLADDPGINRFGNDRSKTNFRLLESRGKDANDKDKIVGVNCVCWSNGLNEKVIMAGLAKGCEALVVGYFVDTNWEGSDGVKRYAKELVVESVTVLDWARDGEQRLAA